MSFNEYIAEAATIELPSSDDEADIKQLSLGSKHEANIQPPDSEDEYEDSEDADSCSAQQLAKEFRVHYKKNELSSALERVYILSLCTDAGFTRLVAGLSNTDVKIYDLNEGGCLTEIYEGLVWRDGNQIDSNKNPAITGVRFLEDNPYTLLVGTTSKIRLFDLRLTGVQAKFEKPLNCKLSVPKSMCCFDRNANSRILCCGTKTHCDSGYLMFYDIRKRDGCLGYYNESHSEDVTTVRFHDKYPDLLCSGSTDGLINVYDIKETDEDEALRNTINTESSVNRLNWHQNSNNQEIITCITHTNDFKSYECLEGEDFLCFKRSDITAGIRRKNPGNFNLINAHTMQDKGLFLLAGTNSNKGEILRSATVSADGTLKPLINYVENIQIVRESLYDAKRDLLITGGEGAFISIWTNDASSVSVSNNLKSKSAAAKKPKSTPY